MVKRKWPKEVQARINRLKLNMRTDFAMRGLGDEDLSTMEFNFDVEEGELLSFAYSIELKGGAKLMYFTKNEDRAQVLCNGAALKIEEA